jgi:hypothetical protein
MSYIENGYIDSGYFEGEMSVLRKKVHFVINANGYEDTDVHALLLQQVGAKYEDEISIIFGDSLKLAKKSNGVFSIRNVVGGISEAELEAIREDIPTIDQIISSLNLPSASDVLAQLAEDNAFMTSLREQVLSGISFNLVAANGDIITSGLTYDDAKNAYVLDYDTSLLNDTDYTIELVLA